MLKHFKSYSDLGLLITRIGVGLSYAFIHGWGKIISGPERWVELGGAVSQLIGFELMPVFFGFIAAASEFFGGILIVLGLMFRPACIALAATMFVATLAHLYAWGDGWGGSAHALKMLFVFLGLMFVGPGKHSIDGE